MEKWHLKRIAAFMALVLSLPVSPSIVMAADAGPVIEMGVFSNIADRTDDDGRGESEKPDEESSASGNETIAQPPLSGNVLEEGKTVLPTRTKWKLAPSFNVVKASSSERKIVKASRKKDRSKSTKGSKWYCAQIQVKKPGKAIITLEGANGEKAGYEIYAEDPRIVKPSLIAKDLASVSLDAYVSGTRYLKPISVTSKNPAVATVSGDYSLSISGNGASKITVQYSRRKIAGTAKAKLPAFSKNKVTLKDRPVKLKIKNLPLGAVPEYLSSNPDTVKVNSGGYVAPVSSGTAIITAKIGNVVTECTVTVK